MVVSVIINNYNYGDFVSRAVESVLAQEGPAPEIVVVDDGSTDRSRSVLEAYRGRVTLVLQENAGQAAAINAGVSASSGDILCFLDSDDWWAPAKVAAVSAAMAAAPEAVLLYHRLRLTDGLGQPIRGEVPRSLLAGDLSPRLLRTAGCWPFPVTSAIAVRRSALQAAGPIPSGLRISADAWLVGVLPFLGEVAALPRTLGFYRLHDANNWYRHVETAGSLRKKMRHWETSVRMTNSFLEAHGDATLLRLEDHFPYRLASATLSGATLADRLALARAGLRFAGEPNLARRLRDVLRDVSRLPAPGRGLAATDAAL